jgi:thiamine biosynthesis lipoprotein ApbE
VKFTTIIPIYRNDGSPVAETDLDEILLTLATQFGGATNEGRTLGHWIDPADGQHYRDEGLMISVVCDNAMLAEAEAAVRHIGVKLGQKAMYFEVRDFDGVRFLRLDS